MPNKKINQLDTRVNAALTDYLVVADPSTGYAYKELGSTFVDLAKTTLVPYTGATASVNLGEYGLTAGQLTLDTSPTGTAVVGTTRWNDTIGSSETLLKGGNVLLKDGVDLVARVVNKVTPATTLTKAAYKAVRVSGAQGQRLAVAYAQANNDNNSADTIGLVCETIAQNQEGFIITVGQLLDVNTTGSLQGETWADGDVLYLSPTTAGNLTNIKPTGATGHIVIIGYVEYAHANNGKIYVKVMNGWELDELHNVYISSVANNDVLVYESSTTLWKNKSIATILGYTPADDSLVMKLAGSQTATGYKTFSIGLQTTTGDNYLNYTSGATYIGYSAAPVGSYKFAVSGDVLFNSTLKIQSNVGGGNTFLTIANQAGTSIATLTNAGALQFSGTATFSNTIGFNGKIGGSSTGGIAIVPGGVPSSLNASQIYLLVSAPLVDYTSTYGLDQAGIYLGGTYNGGQGPQNMVLGPARYYNSGGTASNKWNFTVSPASGQVSDGFGSDLILTGGIGRGTGTPGKFIIQTSTATTTGTTLQTLSNRLEVDGTGQLKLNGYTSTSVFTGTVAGLLGFDSSGNVITTSASGGGITGSGTAGQVTYWTGSSAVGGGVNFVYQTSTGNLQLGTSTTSGYRLDINGTGASTGALRVTGGSTLIVGGGNTSATTALTVQNSDANSMIRVLNDGKLVFSAVAAFPYIAPTNGTSNTPDLTSGSHLLFISNNNDNSNGNPYGFAFVSSFQPQASGTPSLIRTGGTFTQASVNGGFNVAHLVYTINQTGTANGITRGLYVNPTLTAAADWRSIEWSNSTGWGLYGAGSAQNFLAGNLGIGTTTINNSALRVNKAITGSVTQSSIANSSTINSDVTTAAWMYVSSPSTQAATFTLAEVVHFNAFNLTIGAGSTVTNQFGFRATSSLTGATNNYGFYGDIASGTGRWNLYMNGTADNYLNGNLGIGITPTVKLHVSGDTILRGSGATSATTALTVQNSSSTNLFTVRNDGLSSFGGDIFVSTSGANASIQIQSNTSSTIFDGNAQGSGTVAFELRNLGTRRFRILGTATNTTFESSNQTGSFIFGNRVSLFASSTTKSSLNIPSGTAPTSPNDGDIWYDGTNIFIRVGGSTKTFTIV